MASSPADAARLTVEPAGHSPTGVYALYLASEDTVFNGLGMMILPDFGAQFLDLASGNVAGVPRPPGDPFTYRNRMLDADPLDIPESKQWTILGAVHTPGQLAFSGGPLGQTIDTSGEPGGKLFLANVKLPPGGVARVTLQLVNGLDMVYTQTRWLPVPEPAGLGLMGLGTLALLARRCQFLGRTPI